MRTIAGPLLLLLSALSVNAADVTITAGLPVTPNRTATDTYSGAHLWNQESRIGPGAGISYRLRWGLFGEANWSNTSTRLADYSINYWTMNRVSIDAGYEHRWRVAGWVPYMRAGIGTTVFISGEALNATSAGLDCRLDELGGAGVRHGLSRKLSAVLEYDARFLRNPDFADHTWHPQRNVISEPKIGITYTLGVE